MIEDGQGKMWLAIAIRFYQQITAPCDNPDCAGSAPGILCFNFRRALQNPILVLAARVCYIGLAHPHLSPVLATAD